MTTNSSCVPSRPPAAPNAAVTQALYELRAALRAKLDAERESRAPHAPARTEYLLRCLATARARVERARSDLDSMLLDD